MIKRLQDYVFAFLQKRCDHKQTINVDVLEGKVDGLRVLHCHRCGAIKTDWDPQHPDHKFISLDHTWRSPDPFSWRYWK